MSSPAALDFCRDPTIEVFQRELHAFVYRAILEVADEAIGVAAIDALLAKYGVARAQVLDGEAWVSLAFTEAFLDDVYRAADDPLIYARAARLAMTPRYMGPRYAFMRAFLSPMGIYLLIARTVGTMNKTGTYTVEQTGSSSCVLTFAPVPGIGPEKTPHMCRFRAVTIAGVPTIFDLAPAHLDQPSCIARGDSVCTYRLSWTDTNAKLRPRIGAAIGLVTGGLYVFAARPDITTIGFVMLATTLCGWAIGTSLRVRAALVERANDVLNSQDALETSLHSNELRFAELMQAKSEVEQKVEERTAQLREATTQLSQTLERVQALDRAKTSFFDNVSHELRSPLTLILAPLEELMAGRLPPGADKTAYKTMHRNASRLLRLINQLLDLAKIDAGQMTIAAETTDLVALVRTCVNGFESAACQKQVALDLIATEGIAPLLLDAMWIDSAITNLLANALRLTPAGGGVRAIVEDHGQYVSVAISDDGPGVAPEDAKKIFERFAQGDSTKRVIGGTGIGLALVREAARLHGGDVELVSELGAGATFTLKIPRRAGSETSRSPRSRPSWSPKHEQVDEFQDLPHAADHEGPSPGAPLALVVEDNAELRVFIAAVLSSRYRVRAANDGASGLALARQLRPDVIVSDVAMPVMDGYELCRQLHADPNIRHIPVLLVTARTDTSSVLQGFEAGASDYLLKPFHATELLARVDVHVQLRRVTALLARQERLAALGSLAATVAHNVRNPLSALISGLPAIRARLAPTLDASSNELMGIMLDCAERIEQMTLDLLDLSRIDREVSGDFAPGAGLMACTRMVGPRVTLDLEMRVVVDDKTLSSGRAGDVNHVFMNVLDNALRAAGDKGTIEIRGAVEADSYVVTIADSGPGIRSELVERIFEPFWTTRAAGEGTGLGLSIARQIMDEHGGSIRAGASTLGGALFTIRLPLKVAERAVA